MKKLVILMALALAMSTAALANPVFKDRGAEASNPLYEGEAAPDHNGGVDILGMGAEKLTSREDTTKPHSKYKAEIYSLQFGLNNNDPDSDGDGVSLGELKSQETIPSNRGEIVSAVKSEKKPVRIMKRMDQTTPLLYQGIAADLDDDDGRTDAVVKTVREDGELRVSGVLPQDWKLPLKADMNKAELIEQMASESGLSKADAKKALDAFINATTKDTEGERKSAGPQTGKEIKIPAKTYGSEVVGEIILGEDRDMVMPGNSADAPHGNGLIDEVREDDKVEYRLGNGGFIVPVAMDKGLRYAGDASGKEVPLARGIDKKDIRRGQDGSEGSTGKNIARGNGDVNVEELELAVEKIERAR